MTYRGKYGKYDITIDGMVMWWFRSYEKAKEKYDSLARYPDELDGTLELVDRLNGEVLEVTEPED